MQHAVSQGIRSKVGRFQHLLKLVLLGFSVVVKVLCVFFFVCSDPYQHGKVSTQPLFLGSGFRDTSVSTADTSDYEPRAFALVYSDV